MKKETNEHVQGQPLEFDITIDGETRSYRLICPMCGEANFVLSPNFELGGCSSEGCPCVCLERLRDYVDTGGIGWIL